MDRRLLWLCVLVGSTIGGLAPEAWGASSLGMSSFLLSALGGLAGVWLAARLGD